MCAGKVRRQDSSTADLGPQEEVYIRVIGPTLFFNLAMAIVLKVKAEQFATGEGTCVKKVEFGLILKGGAGIGIDVVAREALM